jgi:hypothetical protein
MYYNQIKSSSRQYCHLQCLSFSCINNCRAVWTDERSLLIICFFKLSETITIILDIDLHMRLYLRTKWYPMNLFFPNYSQYKTWSYDTLALEYNNWSIIRWNLRYNLYYFLIYFFKWKSFKLKIYINLYYLVLLILSNKISYLINKTLITYRVAHEEEFHKESYMSKFLIQCM